MTCEKCGAVVGDVAKHDEWHAALDQVELTADEALDKAEYANNVLYQKGIQL